MKEFSAELHIHTALSPCADNDMTPQNIVRMAKLNGIDILGITDHNSAENAEAVFEAASDYGITVFYGMEIQTREEVHLLCYLKDIEDMLDWQEYVYLHLPLLENEEQIFGQQLIIGSDDVIRGRQRRLLLNSVDLGVAQVADEIRKRDGLCIPAHIDRSSGGIIAVLGFLPPDAKFDGFEVSPCASEHVIDAMVKIEPRLQKEHLVCFQDSHRLEDMCFKHTSFYINEPNFDEIRLALTGTAGRKVVVTRPQVTDCAL